MKAVPGLIISLQQEFFIFKGRDHQSSFLPSSGFSNSHRLVVCWLWFQGRLRENKISFGHNLSFRFFNNLINCFNNTKRQLLNAKQNRIQPHLKVIKNVAVL